MVLLLFYGVAWAGDFGLTIKPTISADLASDRPEEDALEGYTWLRAWARGQEGDLRWFLEGRAQHIVLYGSDLESVMLAELGEAGVSVPLGPGYLEAGHLIERWGRLDLLPLADVLNGRDLRAGPLTPLEVSRIPTPMLTGELPWAWGRLEVVWAPVPGVSRTSVQGTDWSLIRPGMVDQLITDMADWDTSGLGSTEVQSLTLAAASLLNSDDPWTRWQQASTLSVAGMPAAFGQGTDLATRLSLQGGRLDGAVIAGWLRSRQSTLVADEVLISYLQSESFPGLSDQDTLEAALADPVTILAPSGAVVGGELGGTLGGVGLRAEGLWRQRALITQQWLSASVRPEVSAGLGLDYVRGSWLLTTEATWQHRDTTAPDLLLMARDQLQVAAAVQGRVARERLSIQAGGVYDVTFQEYLLRPSVSWRASDHAELGLNAVVLGGRTASPEDLSDALRHTGGIFSYWDQNDCLNAQLTWIR